mmetsp:Transcript_92988/g.266596  ORF Transcript_92988/g.266596 Transcript_92988/m.266596 type:complete len:270 (+) Transcript_92988:859-1668(+)
MPARSSPCFFWRCPCSRGRPSGAHRGRRPPWQPRNTPALSRAASSCCRQCLNCSASQGAEACALRPPRGALLPPAVAPACTEGWRNPAATSRPKAILAPYNTARSPRRACPPCRRRSFSGRPPRDRGPPQGPSRPGSHPESSRPGGHTQPHSPGALAGSPGGHSGSPARTRPNCSSPGERREAAPSPGSHRCLAASWSAELQKELRTGRCCLPPRSSRGHQRQPALPSRRCARSWRSLGETPCARAKAPRGQRAWYACNISWAVVSMTE